MRYQNLKRFNDATFKRLVGVTRPLFDEMVLVLIESEANKKKSGRPHSLSLEDQLLMTLNYLKTYKTQIELAADYNLADSNVHRTIVKVENALIKSGKFNLPTKPSPKQEEDGSNWVIIDVTEHPIERPKKSKDATTVASKNSTP